MAIDLARIGPLLEAASFAARAHRNQIRKDGETPYVAHVFRVCLIVRHVFGIDDPAVLAAALLHDTIEDTTTDYDDVIEHFGPDVAGWVGALSKDKRLADPAREAAYQATLSVSPAAVQIVKLADVLDNLIDITHLPPEKRTRALGRARAYLDALSTSLVPEAGGPMTIVRSFLESQVERNV